MLLILRKSPKPFAKADDEMSSPLKHSHNKLVCSLAGSINMAKTSILPFLTNRPIQKELSAETSLGGQDLWAQ